LTSEEVTALRRKERKQFKKDRAQAMLDASLAAEAILTGKTMSTSGTSPVEPDGEAGLQRVVSATPSSSSTTTATTKTGTRANVLTTVNETFIPGLDEYAHALPEGETRLTPQTFLVRPTRPDQRGAKRRAPPPPATPVTQTSGSDIISPATQQPEHIPEEKAEVLLPPIVVQDFEHLQLNLEEAFFLSWAIGCLKVIHRRTVRKIATTENSYHTDYSAIL
jgi:tRNA-splicing endonuclease subunit Sen2